MHIFRPIILRRHRAARWVVRLLLVGLLLAVIGGHPWIAAWILEGQLESAGGVREGSRSVSYERIVWREVHWSNDGLEVEADRVELGLIPRFLTTWYSPEEAVTEGDVFLSAVGVTIRQRETEATPEESEGPVPDLPAWHRQVADLLDTAERWLPPIGIRDLRLEGPFLQGTVGTGTWNGSRIALHDVMLSTPEDLPVNPQTAAFAVEGQRWGNGLDLDLRGEVGPWRELVGRLRTRGEADELAMDGSVRWEGGAVTGQVQWTGTGWRPATADAQGTIREFAGTPLEREDVPRAAVVLDFAMEDEGFGLFLDGEGLWTSPDPEIGTVPWQVVVEAAATPDTYQLGRVEVILPWLEAQLESPLRVERETLTPSSPAELTWRTDAAAWPWMTAEGTASGAAYLGPRGEAEGLTFELTGEGDIRSLEQLPEPYREFGRLHLEVRGEGNRDEILIKEALVDTARWGSLTGQGRWARDAEQEIEAQVEGSLAVVSLEPWLPEGISVDAPLKVSVEAVREAGQWQHSGWLRQPEATVYETVPLVLEAEWTGTETALSSWNLRAESAQNALALAGSATWAGGEQAVTLTELQEMHEGELRWQLAEPVTFRQASGEGDVRWTLGPLRLASVQSAAMVEAQGRMESPQTWTGEVRAEQLGAASISGWYPIPNDQWFVERLDLRGEIVDGELDARTEVRGEWRLRSGEPWEVELEARLGPEGLEIVESSMSSPNADWFRSSGSLPITVRRSPNPGWEIAFQRDQEIQIDLHVDASEPLPPFFAERMPFEYENLMVSAELRGTLDNLEGQVVMQGEMISIPLEGSAEPLRLEEPELRVRLESGAARIETLAFRLPGAPERAEISGTVDNIPWDTLGEGNLTEVLEVLRVQLRADAFPIAALGPFLPELMEPSGTVTLSLQKEGAADISGDISWEGLNLRPLPNGSVPRNVRGQARLEGMRLEGLDLRASISGRTLRATGSVDLEHWPEPLFEIQVEAERIDLVRQLDLILRARGQFQLTRTSLEETPLITGELTLEDSLLLRDLRDFASQGVAGVSRRPPYFSVEGEPMASWRLDVEIMGEEFMRVRTPVFNGVVSADFDLQGTLGAPAAIGQATIDDGAVLFPFARIPLSSGRASISLSDPHTLQLSAHGRGIAFGYDIVLSVEGTAQDPEVTFSSPQGLAQDEIVLMLATGAVPASDRTASTAARAGRIALYFGQDIFSTLFGSGDGASRIEIRSGEGFSPFRRSNQVIEYHFDDDWSVLGENDDFGDYNVDVKWTVYRK